MSMSKFDQYEDNEVICSCSGTTRKKIKSLIQSKRAENLDKISRITGACSGCGACDSTILEILAESGLNAYGSA